MFTRRDFGPPPLRDNVEDRTPPRGAPPARPGHPSAADTGPQRQGAPASSQRGESRPPHWVPAGPGPGPGQGGPGRWQEQRGGQPAATSQGSWSYSDQIRSSELVPTRKVPPAGGWRRAVFKGTFGLLNLGQSPDERRQAELEAKVRSLLRGRYKIGVLGKGGTGKTTIAASVGSLFAEMRQEDRVVAIDADTAFGKLGSRIDPNVAGSYWELAADQHLNTFADIRTRVGNNTSGLFVLAGENSAARRRVLDAAIYREATARLDNHFTISIIDCGSTMDSPVTREVLLDLDALIVVSSPWVDGASAAGQTMDWLAENGYTALLHRTVVVLNDSDGHADKKTRATLTEYFSRHGQTVIELPFDGHLRPGGVVDIDNELDRRTRRRVLEIAAVDRRALSDDYRRAAGAPMTAVRPGFSLPSPSAGDAPLVPSSCRVSILVGDSHQIDLVLPSAVPLSALADATRDAVNRILRTRGDDELPFGSYEFARVAGMSALTADLSLAAQGVFDGELLALVPAGGAQRYGPNIENVSTALARFAQEHFPVVSARDAGAVGAALTAAALAVAAVIVWRLRWASGGNWVPAAVFAAAAAVLVLVALVGSRTAAPRSVVDGTAWAAVAAAVLAGATGPDGASPSAPHAFLASLVTIVGALMLARFTGRH